MVALTCPAPHRMIIQMTFSPEAMKQDVLKLRDSMLSMMERVDASSIHGFITTYGFLCDFFGVTFSEEISWVRHGNESIGMRVWEYRNENMGMRALGVIFTSLMGLVTKRLTAPVALSLPVPEKCLPCSRLQGSQAG